jgi:electron transfer flavoprotein beta subunit
VDVQAGEVTWGDAPLVINPWDEYTVEEGVLLKDRGASAVSVLALGTDATREALKHALAMGCDDATLITDEAFADADSLTVAKALAAAVGKWDDVGLVMLGKMTTDGNGGATPAQVGRALGWPTLTYVAAITDVDFDAGTITVERLLEEGRQTVTAPLPAVLSVVKEINEPRYPSFMGIRKANKAEVTTYNADDLGISPEPKISWDEVALPPAKEGDAEIIEGGSVDEVAKKLADKLMEEKVL